MQLELTNLQLSFICYPLYFVQTVGWEQLRHGPADSFDRLFQVLQPLRDFVTLSRSLNEGVIRTHGYHESTALKEALRRQGIPSYFDQDEYLFYNPDVAPAITAGIFPSAYHHWLYTGFRELRPGAPCFRPADRAVFTPELRRRQYGVNLFGFLSTPSGLGQVARSCHSALISAACPLRSIELRPWAEAGEPPVVPPPEQRYRINLIQQNADMMPLFIRAYGEEILHGCYNIGFWFWELPAARADWRRYYEYVDEIWVASEFCRNSIACLTSLPVVRMPLVVDGLERKAVYSRDHFSLPHSVFLFGYSFDLYSYLQRKNPFALIEAFRREFGDSSDVLLVLKCSHGGASRNINTELIEAAAAGAPNIRVIDREFTESEIASFHNVLDCFVSPHRSEGFGFNLAESMYLGKPVIATRYSGNLDFMDDRNSYLINCRLAPIEEEAGPYMKGAVWAEPDIDHLRKLMRSAFEDAAERASKGIRASETIRRKFNSAEAGRQMQQRFQELGLDKPVVSRSIFSLPSNDAPSSFFHPETPSTVRDEIRGLAHRPLLSVLVTGYNAGIKSRLESIRSQWYPYWELCVCGNSEVLHRYRGLDPRIKIITDETANKASALNRCAEISTGSYLILSGDDNPGPEFLLSIARMLVSPAGTDLRPFSPEAIHQRKTSIICKGEFYAAGGFASACLDNPS